MTLDREFKISVKGEVHLGTELHLDDRPPEIRQRYRNSAAINAPETPSATAGHGMLPGEISEEHDWNYALEKTDKKVSIIDNGLKLQYALFGGPGSGKTNTLVYLLRQILRHETRHGPGGKDRPDHRFGGVILDPKGDLAKIAPRVFAEVGREDDLIIINREALQEKGGVNLLHCGLSPTEIGKILVLSALSAGLGAREPYWFQQMSLTFGAILDLMQQLDDEPPTLARMIDLAVGTEIKGGQSVPKLEKILKHAQVNSNQKTAQTAQDLLLRIDQLRSHSAGDPKNRATLEQFMRQAYDVFRESGNACYSAETRLGATPLYDQIIDDGKFVLVSPGSDELTLTRILPALVKLIVQRTVLGREDRFNSYELMNNKRPVLFMADEYHMIATQLKDEPVGDAEYFSMARHFGGLCIVATQSIQQLKSSGLGDTWESVLAVLAAIISMKTIDKSTPEEMQARAGTKSVLREVQNVGGGDGMNVSAARQRVDVPRLPKDAFALLKKGDAVLLGTTTGHDDPTEVKFAKVPYAWDPL
ncbi:DUF87 domain-containing protein [Cognatiyoonia sp. IB215446]|uniref:type IV secretory system conjugative DNA transfer family protein n=1 Tax=Cognatiyoonia sp. IB215446 TaxID=3097355 RepID=UPI002A167635|nr:type IV secretion system DNA-binding domain-containing protein [Cognatiyoonia sp. IB215446]MDX8349402.1 DUF87 domain-containing protein [Cognatiyoonia sp. IB215446]